MTSIKLDLEGARASAAVEGVLTSGMVGLPVIIECDDAWTGLKKNLICKCSHEFGKYPDIVRTLTDVDTAAEVAHEVMRADMVLYLGVSGFREDGSLVMPTTWAKCGKIQPGAEIGADATADETLPVWARMEGEVARLKREAVTDKQVAAMVAGYVERNLGAANANRYLVTDENGCVTAGGIVGAEDADDIPWYIAGEIETVGAAVAAVQEAYPKSATFAFLTDHHFHYNSEHLVRHNLHAIDEISKRCHVEFAAFGGDNIAENGNGTVALNKVKYFGKILRDYNIRTAAAMGNHDDNSLSGYQADTGKYLADYAVPQSGFYGALNRQNENVWNIAMDTHRDRLYFYIDLPAQQIRVIFLNVIDIPYMDDGSGNLVYTGIHDSGYSNEQLNWVVSDALNFSDKKHPEQWGVITIQHFTDCPDITAFSNGSYVDQNHGGAAMYGIFQAFRKREAFSSVVSGGDFAHHVSCDFTDAKAELICRISGHTHKDWHIVHDGTQYISTMAAGLNGVGVNPGLDGVTYNKTPDSAKESAFDFFTVDRDSRTIHITRFGAGADRTMNWEDGTTDLTSNLFRYGTADDYERYDGITTTDLSVADGQYIRKSDMGSNSGFFFNTNAIACCGEAMTLRASFVSEDGTLAPIARFGLRLFDADGNILITGMSADWKYNAAYNAFYQDTDNVSFTLPDAAVSFWVGFLFSVQTAGKYVRVENITLTAEG